jgi:DNA mismatch endonuclease (patch repair protein)
MNDTLSPEQRSKRMGLIKGRDTAPELVVRLVHRLGYRYRLHRRDLPGCLVFPSRRKIIFVHSCFWHRHPSPECKLARLPKSRQDFWIPKLSSNRERDLVAQTRLLDMGWQIMIVWECEIGKPDLKEKVEGFCFSLKTGAS